MAHFGVVVGADNGGGVGPGLVPVVGVGAEHEAGAVLLVEFTILFSGGGRFFVLEVSRALGLSILQGSHREHFLSTTT